MRQGTRILGSSEIQTSKANEELVPQGKFFYKFSFVNESDSDCRVIINNEEPIMVRKGRAISTNEVDPNIYSFVIIEPGIDFTWAGGE